MAPLVAVASCWLDQSIYFYCHPLPVDLWLIVACILMLFIVLCLIVHTFSAIDGHAFDVGEHGQLLFITHRPWNDAALNAAPTPFLFVDCWQWSSLLLLPLVLT
jgi:predicted membrane chloride channel (bestrophin family)